MSFPFRVLVLVLAFAAASCGGGGGATPVDAGAPDTTPPALASSVPVDGATGVARNVVVTVTFTEPVDSQTLTTDSFKLVKTGATAPMATTVRLATDGRSATLQPGAPLDEGVVYTGSLSTDIRDLAGNKFAARRTFAFTVEVLPLVVRERTPAPGSVGVRGDAPIVVAFDNEVAPASLMAQSFTVKDGATSVAGTLTQGPANTATFRASAPLRGGATLEVTVAPPLARVTGPTLAAPVAWQLVVAPAPALLRSVPASDAVEVAEDAPITLTFDAALDPSSVPGSVRLENAAGAAVAATVRAVGETLTLLLIPPLALGARHTVIVTTGLRSALAVAPAAEARVSFTTRTPPPTVVSTSPADNAALVPIGAPIDIVFDQDMDAASFIAGAVTLFDSVGNAVPVTLSAPDPRTLRATPAAPLTPEEPHVATLTAHVRNRVGGTLLALPVIRFATAPRPAIEYLLPRHTTALASNAAFVVKLNAAPGASAVTPPGAALREALTVYEGATTLIAAVATPDAASGTISLRPVSGNFAVGARHTVRIDGALLRDAGGVAIGGEHVSTFEVTAADAASPLVTFESPPSGTTIARTSTFVLAFNEDVHPRTLTADHVSLTAGGTAIPAAFQYSPSTRRLTVTPRALLPSGQAILLRANGVQDLAGNLLVTQALASFTSEGGGPRVLAALPPANAINVITDAIIRLVFDEALDQATIAGSLTENGEPVLGIVRYHAPSRSLYFETPGPFPPDTDIVFTLAAGLAGATGGATAAPFQLAFRTGAATLIDEIQPAITATLPVNDSALASATLGIVIDFSEALFAPAFPLDELFLREVVSGRALRHVASFDAAIDRLTLRPKEPLRAGIRYAVVVPDLVEDLVGNTIVSEPESRTLTFTVETTRPGIQASTPPSGGTLAASGSVVVTFSEVLDAKTLHAGSVRLETAAGSPLLAGLSYDAAAGLVVSPAAPFAAGSYVLIVERASVRDVAGNALDVSGQERIPFTVQ